MPIRNRVLVIGLDAGTFDIIKPLFDRNKLSVLRTLVGRGVHGELRSTIPPITAPAWTSLVTGKNPGKHGLFDFVARKPGTYEEKLTTRADRKCDAIWNILTRHGRRVIIVNVPLTYPPEEVSGCMISGIGSPENSSAIAYPKSVFEEITSRDPYRVMYDVEPTEANCEKFLADIKALVHTRGRAFRYLMGKIDWDLGMVVFQSTDWVQHFFWRYMDESHPLFTPNTTGCQRNAIAETYEAIDREIGEILSQTTTDDYVFVVSDHGMGPLHKNVYFNNWLEKEGYLRYKPSLRYLAHRAGMTSENAYRLVMKLRAGGAIPKLRNQKEGLIRLFLSMRDVDWTRTKAYSLGLDGNIRLNLRGREPQGIVHPGDEYSRVVSELKSKLHALCDPFTGDRVVDDVYCRDQVFRGPWVDDAPDLVLVLTRYHQDYQFGSNSIFGPPPDRISGNHRPSGILIVAGPGIRRGVSIDSRSLLDVVPTALQLLGIPIPDDLDGEPMAEIYDESFGRDAGHERRQAAESSAVSATVYTDEEEERLKSRLRQLGYL